MEVLKLIGGVIFAYLIGSINSAVWISKVFYKTDIRTKGSKNAGATNTIRVLGLRAGITVLAFDIIKGWLAVHFGKLFLTSSFPEIMNTHPETYTGYMLLLGVFVVLGHIFPVFSNFKGGKGVATIVGVLIALYWFMFPFVLLEFVIIFLIWRYISLASIITALSFPFLYLAYCFIAKEPIILFLLFFSILVAIFIPLTHKKNIKRLLKGEEPTFHFKKNA